LLIQGTNVSTTIDRTTVSGLAQIRNDAVGAMSISYVSMSNNSIIRGLGTSTATVTVSQCDLNYGFVYIESGSTGNVTVGTSSISAGGNVTQNGAAVIAVGGSTIENGSTVVGRALAGGGLSVTQCNLRSLSRVDKVSTSTAGTVSIVRCDLESSGFVQHGGTGILNVRDVKITQSSRVNVTGGDRNYDIDRVTLTEIGQANLSGTGAGIVDAIIDTQINSRASITLSATGAVQNRVIYSDLSGLSGTVSITGTSSGQTVQRFIGANGAFSVANCTALTNYESNFCGNLSSINVSNLAVSKDVNYASLTNVSTLSVNAGTVAGAVNYVDISGASTVTVNGPTGTISRASCEDGGQILFNGGATHSQISKKMSGIFTTGNFSHANVAHWTTASKTATVANSNRADYLGLLSSVPII
jgi:hypothetical protein